ncbi:sucrose synthase [Arthrospira platensis]|jgi:sucrose synthase|uniref:Sucrose synthase n=1 Tax=Limnospira platensis NIES-46 TaxID=1236695 RepID=A0A5M3TDQ0_LIMPL|nr:sucrose synthase [Arthrospira platensis]AMW30681.1 sucrose synthase [Arthrospira platensis YZ]KDR55308.1 sucrose synthase [Arthrospira platensis str. Paraca]MBD2669980.1 sucrose synthase [Arthrospira platensis FACHB-439]MBD2710455.1 sucrose synthase [Arthrospira platensis FACHB-835]MDF2207330.1 sucrose synthase [Arthrospira platensis NCB002]MDT9183084.1 sucrose synthase [Limnospira sp. PMC 289.06]MDT9295430.1 sucrose synthase [Arthrospira platensis PCC 7345]MDT9310788.1 sucrose synthase 
MSELIQNVIESDEKQDLRQFYSELRISEKRYLLRNDILQAFADYCLKFQKAAHFVDSSHLSKLIYYTQEIILENESICLIVRPQIATQERFRLRPDLSVDVMSVQELLDLRDHFVDHHHPHDGNVFAIDFGPFYDYSPQLRDSKNIGKGVRYLNRYLSSKLFQDSNQWLESLYQFLSLHSYNGLQLLINDRITNQNQLSYAIKKAISLLNKRSPKEPYEKFRFELQEIGFEPGWGNTARRALETLEILDELLDSPDHQVLEAFLARIPMIFRIVLVSIHGWFAQEGVLGRPDTGGQIVYILDQARSLEMELEEELKLSGLSVLGVQPKVMILTRLIPHSDGTRCDQRLEKVYGTKNAWILRVPFREFNPNVTQNWISRFEIWPYLETFAIDAETEILAEFQGRPDLIVGNYSDGNLVAFLLSKRLNVIQCNVAHALEKSKYVFSDLYWQDMDDKYHFSLQFTADLIAMNAANFIISSTYQEIIGTTDSVGQYESYKSYTMPGLYHVVNGIELFSPKFNVVPPGVNETIFFPYTRTEERISSDRQRLEELIFYLDDPNQVFGKLADPTKPPLFSVARLDRIKNITGLVECYGQHPELQEKANLIFIAGKLRVEDSSDYEEAEEIKKMYHLIEHYNLYDKVRWLGVRLSKTDTGEMYRVIADHHGIFVQPALFEAFGLTILEAMISGLPTFATQFGGPLEIIKDKINGFYINPTNYDETAAKLDEFLVRCQYNIGFWNEISQRGMDRVYSSYTWKIHTSRLLTLTRVYGFWKYVSKEKRADMMRYLEALFYLIYKPRCQELLQQHLQR